MELLNLASGAHGHPEWTNVELWPHCVRYRAPLVGRAFRRLDAGRPHVDGLGVPIRFTDLRDGIPYADESFDVVYHSNFLEHLDRKDAEALLAECARVLRAGGIIRVVVPDLEVRARAYLAALEAARAGAGGAETEYRWAIVDLYDPVTRTELGGELQAWMDTGWPYVRGRAPAEQPPRAARRMGTKSWIRSALIGEPTPANTGELHRSVWDSYSLARTLVAAGFSDPVLRSPDESAIPGWDRYRLDVDDDGTPRHFDCIYIEAAKRPSGSSAPTTSR